MDVAATTTTTARPPHELVPQLQFPPGYRFVPTEGELVDDYLRAKIEGHKLPLDVVNDVDILEWQPGSLVEEYKGYGENRWFFFTVREQSSSNKAKEPSRKVKVPGVTATWKATGSVQLIRARPKDGGDGDGNNKAAAVVVGTKRVLIYNSSDPNEHGKWSMHEYILKGHAAMGQYALYSIQRKQHSDTEDNASNDDMDSEKKKTKKRKRAEKPCTEPEGVQPPHPETTALLADAEPPLKTARKAKAQKPTRKTTKAQRKKNMQGEGEQQQQQQGQSPMELVTPPKKKDQLAPPQLEGRQQPSAPAPVVISAVPLQAVRVCPPSEPNGTLGASAPPTLEEDTLDDMSQLLALLNNHNHPDMFCNNQGQEQWPPSLTGTTTTFLAAPDTDVKEEDGYSFFGVQNQHLSLLGENQSVYMEQGWQHQQPMNSDGGGGGGGWEHGDDQRHQVHHQQQQQENNGWAFGVVEDQQPMNHPQGGHDLPPPSDEQSPGSDDLVGNLFGESVPMDDELDAFVRGLLGQPQGLAAGTQEHEGGDDAATLRAAGTQEQGADVTATLQRCRELQCFYWQVQRARNEHVWDGPCSCMVCAAPAP